MIHLIITISVDCFVVIFPFISFLCFRNFENFRSDIFKLNIDECKMLFQMSNVNAARIRAFWGALIADSLSMPVHWFYIPTQIPRFLNEYINKYHAAPHGHPTSILQLSSVGEKMRLASFGNLDFKSFSIFAELWKILLTLKFALNLHDRVLGK